MAVVRESANSPQEFQQLPLTATNRMNYRACYLALSTNSRQQPFVRG